MSGIHGATDVYRILLVEDDDGVRTLLQGVLQRAGYEVIEARRGDIAVSLVESTVGPIHLVITDVVLPQLSGYELVQWARSMHPATKVIYMSGYLESEALTLSRNDPNSLFLQKPFSPLRLLAAVEAILGRRAKRSSG